MPRWILVKAALHLNAKNVLGSVWHDFKEAVMPNAMRELYWDTYC